MALPSRGRVGTRERRIAAARRAWGGVSGQQALTVALNAPLARWCAHGVGPEPRKPQARGPGRAKRGLDLSKGHIST
jgi:hypothetical protein